MIKDAVGKWERFLRDLGCIEEGPVQYAYDEYVRSLVTIPGYDELARRYRSYNTPLNLLTDQQCLDMYEPTCNPDWVRGLSIYDQVAKMREVLKVIDGHDRILDVGCGPCLQLQFLKGNSVISADITGTDPSRGMLESARHYGSILDTNANLVQSWMQEMPFDDRAFDLVLSLDSLHWTNRWQIGLREMARLTSKDLFLCYSLIDQRGVIRYEDVVMTLIQAGLDVVAINYYAPTQAAAKKYFIYASRQRTHRLTTASTILY